MSILSWLTPLKLIYYNLFLEANKTYKDWHSILIFSIELFSTLSNLSQGNEFRAFMFLSLLFDKLSSINFVHFYKESTEFSKLNWSWAYYRFLKCYIPFTLVNFSKDSFSSHRDWQFYRDATCCMLRYLLDTY